MFFAPKSADIASEEPFPTCLKNIRSGQISRSLWVRRLLWTAPYTKLSAVAMQCWEA